MRREAKAPSHHLSLSLVPIFHHLLRHHHLCCHCCEMMQRYMKERRMPGRRGGFEVLVRSTCFCCCFSLLTEACFSRLSNAILSLVSSIARLTRTTHTIACRSSPFFPHLSSSHSFAILPFPLSFRSQTRDSHCSPQAEGVEENRRGITAAAAASSSFPFIVSFFNHFSCFRTLTHFFRSFLLKRQSTGEEREREKACDGMGEQA